MRGRILGLTMRRRLCWRESFRRNLPRLMRLPGGVRLVLWPGEPRTDHEAACLKDPSRLKSLNDRAVVSHISRKTSEMWATRRSWLGQSLEVNASDQDRESAGTFV